MLRTAKVSEVRRALGEYVTDAAHRDVVTVISRYDNEQVFLLGRNTLVALIEAKVPCRPLRIQVEDDGSYTVCLDDLDVAANGQDYEAAVQQLLGQVRMYAEEFFSDPTLYLRDRERRHHLPLLMSTELFADNGELRGFLGIPSDVGTPGDGC